MKIYLNKAFLVTFLLNKDPENELHFFVNRLLSNPKYAAEIIVDFDFEEAYNDNSLRPLFRQIAQKLPISDSDFLASCQNGTFHDDSITRIFLLDEMPSVRLSERFGCVSSDSDSLEKLGFLFYSEDIRIDASKRDWSQLAALKHPCNAMIITDNYLFSNDEKLENISSILKSLMPATLETGFQFHLTVIGFNAKKSFHPIVSHKSELEAFLKNQFSYEVNLTIIREDYHDRNIFTNYTRITSGKGFSSTLLKQK